MAIKFKIPDFKFFKNADAKTRIFIVFAAVAALVLIIFLIVRYFGGGAPVGGTRVANAPSSLQTVPGAQMSPEFYRAVAKANEQATQQAQISGGSAVPQLINVPGQATGFPDQNCTVLCPGDDNANVSDDIAALVRDGKLSEADANHLLNLAKNNVSVDEYAAALNELVRQGKLTPEQARALLEKYKKQHANAKLRESGAVMDAMIKAGQLPVDIANDLLALQKRGVSPAEYAAELNRLVREGKLTPAAAAQLLAQYTQQQMQEEAKKGAFVLQQMAKSGEITPDVANGLLALQNRGASVDEYAAELNRLVAAGKMTPAAAAKLLEQYKKQRAGIGPTESLNSLVSQEQAKANALLGDLVKNGRMAKTDADAISDMIKAGKSQQEIQNALNALVQAKKLSPADAQRILMSANKVAAMRALAQRLAALQGNNASLEDFAEELKRAVAAGLITPEMAALLMEQYRAFKTPVTPPEGGAPGVEANIPGAAAFAQLQKKVETGAPQPPAPIPGAEQFAVPLQEQVPPPVSAESAQDRQQKLDQLMQAMSAQAQNLIAAWQPPLMVHKEGSGAETKGKGEAGAAGSGTKEGSSSTTTTTTTQTARPLIKAGTILFGVLETAVDSDYPDTPVMVTIIQGPFKGARLLGKLSLAQGKDKVSLNFNLMDKDDWATTKSVNAFAIDPDTARTVMASSVDNHYLKRYGAIMATSFLSGYSSAITTSGSTTTNGIFGPTTTHPELSPQSKIAVGLGQIGTTMSAAVANYINTPTTVKVNSGVGLGILFMGEVPA